MYCACLSGSVARFEDLSHFSKSTHFPPLFIGSASHVQMRLTHVSCFCFPGPSGADGGFPEEGRRTGEGSGRQQEEADGCPEKGEAILAVNGG